MSMITYPLNNVEYTAEDAELYNATRTSGVYSGADFDWTLTGEDNNITVGKGLAWIKNGEFAGKVVAHKDAETLDFGVAPSTNGRVDVLAIRFSSAENKTELVIKKGLEDGNYTIPERSTDSGVYELYLFSVRRAPGAGYISNEDITDLRDNREYCGYMSESVKDGYAPSLMEHNNGLDFRFWVGTEEEYQEQKDELPPNTFCLTTDGEVVLKSWSDVDNVTSPGWYRFSGGISVDGVSYNYAYMRVDSYNNKHATQYLYPVKSSEAQKVYSRNLQSSTWSGWVKEATGAELDELKESLENVSGFGLGSAETKRWSDVNTLTSTGWYRFSNSVSAGGISVQKAYMRVDAYDNDNVTQTLYLVRSGERGVLLRNKTNGTWEREWAWQNPPMLVNTEYKTTEVWSDKPVYTTRTRFAAEAYKDVSINLGSTTAQIIRQYANDSFGALPQFSANGDLEADIQIYPKTGKIVYRNIGANVSGSVYVQIWYVKE